MSEPTPTDQLAQFARQYAGFCYPHEVATFDEISARLLALQAEVERYRLAEPMITEHLNQLVMDTPEDNELLATMRATWRMAVTGQASSTLGAPVAPLVHPEGETAQ